MALRTYQDYQIGIICALALERAALEEMLDEEHPRLNKKKQDDNDYTLGRIGVHNVAIACLPAGLPGIGAAAAVAKDMRRSFPIQFGLLAGIGGGVWSQDADVRLGDVVVSHPKGTHGGVVQYDFGEMEDGNFKRRGALDKPPHVLLQALQRMKTKEVRGRAKMDKLLFGFFAKSSDILETYGHPGADQDQLFKADYIHQDGNGANTCTQCKIENVVSRSSRTDSAPRIHYGTIASGNLVMRDAAARDRIDQSEGGVICFETEAAGLMDNFPCLVIRGISDYADSHKNDKWQYYAAATAAVVVGELLSSIDKQEEAVRRARQCNFP
jgi:nucleoside phosphorylase